ncbi:MAG: cytochrome c maturation protein CcmE [Gammaproteobacteria bacterium]|nr:cytochrome c maturation protein CcmE [Gammaproteobacteria bacterium]
MKARRQRMIFVGVVLAGVAIATALALTAIGENMLYFYSPSQIAKGEAPRSHDVRVGGLVVDGSIERAGDGLDVRFVLTDTSANVPVAYSGILPDLFREGQGIVALGRLGDDGVFRAREVLAKHDENYMPPEVAEALELAAEGGQMPHPVKTAPKPAPKLPTGGTQ